MHTFAKVNIYGGIPGVDINPILVYEVEQFKIGDFGYYVIDNEYMYIFCDNKNVSIYLNDHTIIRDEKLLNIIKTVITKYVHDRLMKTTELIMNGGNIK